VQCQLSNYGCCIQSSDSSASEFVKEENLLGHYP
jgi:hypothetical protein